MKWLKIVLKWQMKLKKLVLLATPYKVGQKYDIKENNLT